MSVSSGATALDTSVPQAIASNAIRQLRKVGRAIVTAEGIRRLALGGAVPFSDGGTVTAAAPSDDPQQVALTDADPEEQSTRVLVDEVTVARDGALLLIRVVGSHFLWKMVRRIVGVLVETGRGALPVARVATLLSSDSDLPPRLTAPASGLFLERVFYEGDLPLPPLQPTRAPRRPTR